MSSQGFPPREGTLSSAVNMFLADRLERQQAAQRHTHRWKEHVKSRELRRQERNYKTRKAQRRQEKLEIKSQQQAQRRSILAHEINRLNKINILEAKYNPQPSMRSNLTREIARLNHIHSQEDRIHRLLEETRILRQIMVFQLVEVAFLSGSEFSV